MRITWRERLIQEPQLWQFANWPVIPLDGLPSERRRAFFRNLQIIQDVLTHTPLGQVASKYSVSPQRISQLLDRALGGEATSAPALTQALVPHHLIANKQRKRPLPTTGKRSGTACAFEQLLDEVPGLREGLDAMILAALKDAPYAQRLSPQAFHGEFKRLLAEAHWPQERYPYTTASMAYQSVRRHSNQRTAALQRERQQRRSPPPRNLGLQTAGRDRALRAIQIDEHTVDLHGSVHLQLNDELIPLRIARVSVLVAVDVDTRCVLGYHLTPTISPNQDDLLSLLDNCITPWQPLELTMPGLAYTPGAGFPSGLAGGFPISFGVVQLDNALMHRARSVIDFLAMKYGATLSYGLPAMPEVRQLVESVFDYVERGFGHRVASTTGSYPTDPKRESRKNARKTPVITYQMLDEALSVLLANYNITPRPSLGKATPLALFEHHCASHFVRYVPQQLSQQWKPLVSSKVVTLHWYRNENRSPHVNFEYERYQGAGLLDVAGKVKQLRVIFDRRDIRTLHAYTLTGEDLGTLQVSRPWQRFAHTLATRKWIHTHAREYQFSVQDPLSDYFHYLLDNKGKPKGALSLLRVYSEFTYDRGAALSLGKSPHEDDTPPLPRPSPRTPIWHPSIANHRKE